MPPPPSAGVLGTPGAAPHPIKGGPQAPARPAPTRRHRKTAPPAAQRRRRTKTSRVPPACAPRRRFAGWEHPLGKPTPPGAPSSRPTRSAAPHRQKPTVPPPLREGQTGRLADRRRRDSGRVPASPPPVSYCQRSTPSPLPPAPANRVPGHPITGATPLSRRPPLSLPCSKSRRRGRLFCT
jgi:hypothetical protein